MSSVLATSNPITDKGHGSFCRTQVVIDQSLGKIQLSCKAFSRSFTFNFTIVIYMYAPSKNKISKVFVYWAFPHPHSFTLDINTTHSTWNDSIRLMSSLCLAVFLCKGIGRAYFLGHFPFVGICPRHFTALSVRGNKSN